jgi:hypothetical protein
MRMIATILNNFDFNRVQTTMKHLNWGWHAIGVPTVDDIIFAARERIESAIKGCLIDARPNQEYSSSSGGLKATVMKDEYGQIDFIELEFILTSWDVSPDTYEIEV